MRQARVFILTMACLMMWVSMSVAAQEAASVEQPAASAEAAKSAEAAPEAKPEPAPEAAPEAKPEPEVKPEPAPAPAPTVKRDYLLQFGNTPVSEVIRRFAQSAGRPILGDVPEMGNLNFFDEEPYSYTEALDVLNTLLAMRNPGFYLIEQGRYLRVVPIPQVTAVEAKVFSGLADTGNARPAEIVTVLLPLKNLDAEVAKNAVLRMVSGYGYVAAMGRGKGVIVSDHLANIQRVKLFLDELDKDVFSQQQIRTFALERTQARNIVNVVNTLFAWKGDPRQMPDDWAFAAADDRSNTLVIVGVGPKLTLSEEMVKQLDSGSGPRDGDMRIYQLKEAKARSMADTLRQALTANRPDGHVGVSVVADEVSNQLVVTVPPALIEQVEGMIKQLDVSVTASAMGFRVYRLKNTDANQLANVVRELMNRVRDQRTGIQPAAVMADGPTNSVVITGLASDIELATGIIKELDDPEEGAKSRDVRVIPFKGGNAGHMVNVIRNLFAQQRPGQQGASSLRVESDPTGSALIISANAGDWQLIQEILKQVELNTPAASVVSRMISVANIRPSELAGSLHHLYNSRGRPVQVLFVPSDRTSTLLVSAPADEMEAIAELIQSLDAGPSAPRDDAQIITLTSSNAPRLVDTIRQMIPQDMQGRIQITADAISNSVLLRAPASERQAMAKLIADLDVEIGKETSQIQTVTLQHVSAGHLANVLMQIYGRQQQGQQPRRSQGGAQAMVAADLVIVPAPGDKALIIEASPSKMELVLSMVKQLDVENSAPRDDVQIIRLSGDAPRLAEVVRQMIPPDMQGRVQVIADALSNSVLLRAPAAERQAMADLIAKLDVEITIVTSQIQTVTLEHVSAGNLANVLMQIYGRQQQGQPPRRSQSGTQVMVAADLVIIPAPGDKTLIIEASPPKLEQILAMVKQLDVENGAPASGMRVIQLKTGEAFRIADAVRNMIPPDLREQMQVVADAGSNSVIIRGPETAREALEEVVAKLDATARSGMRQTRIVKFEQASAVQMAGTLQQLYVNRSGDPSQQVLVVAAGDKQLVIDAPESLVETVCQMAASLDVQESVTAQTVRVYTLKAGSAPEIAQSLARLYQQRDGGGRGPSSQPPRFEASGTSNQVIVSASEDQFKIIGPLIEELQQNGPVDIVSSTQTFVLKYARARDLVPVLQNMLSGSGVSVWQGGQWPPRGGGENAGGEGNQGGDGGGNQNPWQRGGGGMRFQRPGVGGDNQFRVAALESGNAVIVQGTPDKLALAAELIKTFDVPNDAEKVTIQIIHLESAKADSLAASIMQSLAANQGQRPAGTQVSVTAEMNTNSLLVRGLPADIEAVGDLVTKLDVGGETRVEMKLYPLKNSDAVEIAKTIETLLGGVARVSASMNTGRRGGGGSSEGGYSVAVDERTNTLIVYTTPANFMVIETLLASLDKEEVIDAKPRDRDVQYVWLDNQKANTVVSKVQAMFSDRKLGERPYIDGDSYFNYITIIGKRADIDQAVEMIGKLDSRPVKENIQVKVFPLTAMRADKMADVIERVYGQMTTAPIDVVKGRLPSRESLQGAPESSGGGFNLDFRPALLEESAGPSVDAAQAGAAGQESGPVADGAAADPRGTAPETAQADSSAAADDDDFVPPSTLPITISVDKESNSLIVSATRAELQNLEAFIDQLTSSTSTSEMDVKMYTIKSADVTAISHTLDQIFNPQSAGQRQGAAGQARQGQRGPRGQVPQQDPNQPQDPNNPQPQPQPAPPPAPTVIFVPDARTKTLIVRAKPVEFEMIQVLLDTLDRPSGTASELRVFALKNVDASELAANVRELFQRASARMSEGGEPNPAANGNEQRAEMVRQMLELQAGTGGGGGGNISISANRQSNSVIVAASPEDMRIVEGLVRELDQSAGGKTVVVRLYPVRAGSAEAVANSLRQAFGTGGNFGGGGGRRGQQVQAAAGDAPFSISSNEESRVVIVSADPDRHELVKKVLDELNAAAEAAGASVVRVYRLENAVAQGAAGALRDAVSNNRSIRISADGSNNSIIVNAPESEHERLAALLAEIDKPTTSVPVVRTIVLKNADPTNTANILTRIFAQSQQAGPRRGNTIGQNLSIEVDIDSKTLMVRSDEETFEKVQQLAAQIDATSPRGKSVQTVFMLQKADAVSIAPSLVQAFAPRQGERLTPDDLVQIVAEVNSNSVIVTANETNLKKVETLIAKLDTESTGGNRSELLVLKNAKAADLSNVLTRMAANVPRGKTPVIVSADEGSNALVFSGPGTELDKLVTMAIQLDQASTGGAGATGVYVVPLQNGQAATVAATVRDIYNQQANAARAMRKTIDPLAVTADARANALIIATTKDMYEQVSGWVTQVEKLTPSQGRLRIITVPNADPLQVERAIQQIYGGQGSGRPARIGEPEDEEEDEDEAASQPAAPPKPEPTVLLSGGGGKVETTVLVQQRALLITAGDEDFEAIQVLVKIMDDEAAKNRKGVQLFEMKNAGNQQVAQAVNMVFARIAERAEDQVSATPLQGTRVVVVAAAAAKMQDVAALIAQLDKEELSPKVEFRVYPLKNTTPQKLLPTMQTMLNPLRQARPGEQINVSADDRTRSLIVTASAAVFGQIDAIIEALDRTPDHVKAEVLMIALKKATAAQLATVLTQTLTPGSDGQSSAEARALQEQIRQIRVRSTLKDEIPELDLTVPIKVTADAGSNSLILTSTPENLKSLAAVVEMMDMVPVGEGVVVRVAHLQNADAPSVMNILGSIFRQGQQLMSRSPVPGRTEPSNVSGKALVNPLSMAVDPRTNTLILAGMEETVALAEIVLRDLDRDETKFVTEVRLFKLKNASAMTLANTIRTVFAEGQGYGGNDGLNTQITRLKLIMEQTGTLPAREGDDSPDESQGEQVGERPDVAATQPAVVESSTVIAKWRPTLAVQADAASNIIIVAARSDMMPLIADVIATMDIAGAATGPNDVRILPLTNADASRLSQMISAIYSGPAASQIRPEDRPTIVVDTRTNALVVSATEKTVKAIEELVARLDAKSDVAQLEIRLLKIENVDAAEVGATVSRIMDARVQRLQAQGVRDADASRVTIVADTRSNSLIIGGSAEGYELIKAIVAQISQAEPALAGQIQLIPLTNANAATLAPSLTNLFNLRYQTVKNPDLARQRPIILSDLRSNSLMVVANADDSKLLAELLVKLDVKLTDAAVGIHVVPLANITAAVASPMIQNVFTARLTAATPAGQQIQPQDRVTVQVEPLSNSLIVVCSKENLDLLGDLLDKVDVKLTDTGVGIHVVPMKNIDAAVASPMIQNVFTARLTAATPAGQQIQPQDRVTVQVEPLSNSLIVVCSKENLELLDVLLDKVDVEPAVADGVVEIIELKNATADNVRALLQSLISQGLYKPGTSGTVSAAQAAREKITIVAEPRMNLLLVSASKENLAIVRQLVTTLDDNKLQQGDIRIFAIKNANVTQLTPTLVQFFNQKLQAERAVNPSIATATMQLVAIADVRTNTLLVAGGKDHFDFVEKMLEQLDGPGAAANEFRRFQLEHATAATLGPMLQNLFTQRLQTGKSKEAVIILPDAASNLMLISASPEDMVFATDIIKLMDVKSEVPDATRVFPLSYADAAQMAQVLVSLYRTGATASAIVIASDARTNSILVTAGAADIERVEEMIRKLDIAETLECMMEIRMFQLVHADVTELAATLNGTLNGRPAATPGASANRAALLQFVTRTPEGKDLVASALQEGVLLTPDRRTNVLIVKAPVENMPLLESVIKALDTISPMMVEIEIFPLQNAAARQMAQVLTELFRLDNNNNKAGVQLMMPVTLPGGGTATLVPNDGTTDGPPVAGTGDEPVLAVTVDTRTNSLLVAGTKTYLDMARQVITKLDSQTAQERKTQVYRMKNSQAADIQTALREFLDRERQSIATTIGQGSVEAAERLLEREVAIVAERATNTLLVSASPQYFDRIAEMILELDTAPPQVLIQVLLAEVTLDNTVDLGFEWTHMGSVSGYATRAGTNFGISADTSGGFSMSMAGENLNLFLRALQSQGRVEVLSRPQILATDNMEAMVNVGQRVPVVTNITYVGANADIPQSSIRWEDVGVRLSLTPRINHEGQVKIDVTPKVDSLSSSNVALGAGIFAPVINTREARTTVTVQDGHTIILGGLITTSDEKREEKVPVLGDIPLLGWLFKHQKTIKQRTELLIILTPHVVRDSTEVNRTTNEQIEQINLLRKLRAGTSNTGDAALVPASQPAAIPDGEVQTVPQTGGNTQDELDKLNTADSVRIAS